MIPRSTQNVLRHYPQIYFARHLGVGAPALPAQLQRLEDRCYAARRARLRDRRQIELRLTALGAKAMATTSILEPDRVTALLVHAARQLQLNYPKPKKSP